MPIVEPFHVLRTTYHRHIKKTTGSESVRVDYLCTGPKVFSRWFSFNKEAHPQTRHKAHEWWRQCYDETVNPIPNDNDEAIAVIHAKPPRQPRTVHVWINGQHPRIMRMEF